MTHWDDTALTLGLGCVPVACGQGIRVASEWKYKLSLAITDGNKPGPRGCTCQQEFLSRPRPSPLSNDPC